MKVIRGGGRIVRRKGLGREGERRKEEENVGKDGLKNKVRGEGEDNGKEVKNKMGKERKSWKGWATGRNREE